MPDGGNKGMTRRFVKKPLEIEAFRYGHDAQPDWFLEHKDNLHETVVNHTYLSINTLEGVMRANPGDYVIKGIKGEIYPCKEDVFILTYDEVNAPYIAKSDALFDATGFQTPGNLVPAEELSDPQKHIIKYTYDAELFLQLAIDLINLKKSKEAKMQLEICLDKINGIRNLVL